jgi:hypothetical protein
MNSLFVSLVYCAESTVRWFVVREKQCWMAADSADKSNEQGGKHVPVDRFFPNSQANKPTDQNTMIIP